MNGIQVLSGRMHHELRSYNNTYTFWGVTEPFKKQLKAAGATQKRIGAMYYYVPAENVTDELLSLCDSFHEPIQNYTFVPPELNRELNGRNYENYPIGKITYKGDEFEIIFNGLNSVKVRGKININRIVVSFDLDFAKKENPYWEHGNRYMNRPYPDNGDVSGVTRDKIDDIIGSIVADILTKHTYLVSWGQAVTDNNTASNKRDQIRKLEREIAQLQTEEEEARFALSRRMIDLA